MENETEVIKHQMEETRSALTEKLEAVEELVASTVKETTQAVTDTVETVTGTVESTVNTVAESVENVTESVKNAFDIRGYVDEHPWLVLGGSVAVGYLLGSLLPSSRPSGGRSWGGASASYAPSSSPTPSASAASYTGDQQASTGGMFSSLLEGLTPVVDKLKGLALGTAASVVGEMIVKNLPDNLKSEVTNLIDDTTRRLGGSVLHEKW
jgi:ElaB/YqjD/DUF883 family membrane-anchored ribosome-binding protein